MDYAGLPSPARNQDHSHFLPLWLELPSAYLSKMFLRSSGSTLCRPVTTSEYTPSPLGAFPEFKYSTVLATLCSEIGSMQCLPLLPWPLSGRVEYVRDLSILQAGNGYHLFFFSLWFFYRPFQRICLPPQLNFILFLTLLCILCLLLTLVENLLYMKNIVLRSSISPVQHKCLLLCPYFFCVKEPFAHFLASLLTSCP